MDYELGLFGVLNADAMEEEPLLLLDGGIERRKNEHYDFDSRQRGGFGGYLFQYTLRGEGVFIRSGREYRVRPGCGFFIAFPEDSRYFLPKEPDAEWEFLYLHFSGQAAAPFARRLSSAAGDLLVLDEGSGPVVMALGLQKRLLAGGRLKPYEGGEFLYRFLCALLREAEAPGEVVKSPLVSQAAEYMRRDFSRLQGIEETARLLGVSPAHLSRCFKKEMGITPVEFLTRQRIQAAMNALLGTDKTVEEIARENGFSSGNYFCRVFRRSTGISPAVYRSRRGPVR